MQLLQGLGLTPAVAIFLASAAVILVVGTRLTNLSETIADRTGLGEAVVGGVLLGATTSLSGTITSVTSAWTGNVDLSYSNAVGGIAAQTLFLAVADLVHRRANLEHAAASVENLTQATMLVILLCVPLIATLLPPVTLFGIHPASVALIAIYVAGVRLAMRDRKHPMWQPRETRDTRQDVPAQDSFDGPATRFLWMRYGLFMLLIGVAGFLVARTGSIISDETGIAGSVVGALMTATVTSLPELVTTIAAVRQGALQLAVGGIIGGNTFDVLFLSASDVAYREGSLYNAVSEPTQLWPLVSILMTGILLVGLIRRERYGPANIGFESVALILVYFGAAAAAVIIN